MVANTSHQRIASNFLLILIAGLSQGIASRVRRTDSKASEEVEFVPHSPAKQTIASAGGVKVSNAAEPRVSTFANVKLNGPPAKQGYRQALSSLRMNANSGDSTDSGDSMRELALAAMDSAGDPSQIAAFVTSLEAEDQNKLETLKIDVLEKAKNMPGVTGPLGFFDPAGFCTDCAEGRLCFYREVELKHGRVAMLAALGFIVAEQFHPLFGGDVDVPSYLAFQQTPLQTFWSSVVAAIAIPELFYVFQFEDPDDSEALWMMKTDRVPGDIGFDPFRLKPQDPEKLKEMQTKEINNGRLAMIASAGMVAQELASGQKLF
jgi:hypothetical protein